MTQEITTCPSQLWIENLEKPISNLHGNHGK